MRGSRAVPPGVTIEHMTDAAAADIRASEGDFDEAITQPGIGPASSHDGRSSGGRRRRTAHLHSAARTLQQILGEPYLEHDLVVTVGGVDRPDRPREAAALVALDEDGAVANHSGPLGGGLLAAALTGTRKTASTRLRRTREPVPWCRRSVSETTRHDWIAADGG